MYATKSNETLNVIDPEKIHTALEDLRLHSSGINWFRRIIFTVTNISLRITIAYSQKGISLNESGTGGIEELKQHLGSKETAFAVVEVVVKGKFNLEQRFQYRCRR